MAALGQTNIDLVLAIRVVRRVALIRLLAPLSVMEPSKDNKSSTPSSTLSSVLYTPSAESEAKSTGIDEKPKSSTLADNQSSLSMLPLSSTTSSEDSPVICAKCNSPQVLSDSSKPTSPKPLPKPTVQADKKTSPRPIPPPTPLRTPPGGSPKTVTGCAPYAGTDAVKPTGAKTPAPSSRDRYGQTAVHGNKTSPQVSKKTPQKSPHTGQPQSSPKGTSAPTRTPPVKPASKRSKQGDGTKATSPVGPIDTSAKPSSPGPRDGIAKPTKANTLTKPNKATSPAPMDSIILAKPSSLKDCTLSKPAKPSTPTETSKDASPALLGSTGTSAKPATPRKGTSGQPAKAVSPNEPDKAIKPSSKGNKKIENDLNGTPTFPTTTTTSKKDLVNANVKQPLPSVYQEQIFNKKHKCKSPGHVHNPLGENHGSKIFSRPDLTGRERDSILDLGSTKEKETKPAAVSGQQSQAGGESVNRAPTTGASKQVAPRSPNNKTHAVDNQVQIKPPIESGKGQLQQQPLVKQAAASSTPTGNIAPVSTGQSEANKSNDKPNQKSSTGGSLVKQTTASSTRVDSVASVSIGHSEASKSNDKPNQEESSTGEGGRPN